MSINLNNNVNSAIISGLQGFQRASDGITQTSISLAQQQASLRDTNDLLADVATSQLGQTKNLLSGLGGDSLTSDLVSLQVNLTNAQASTKVIDTAQDTIGKIIDETA